MAASNIEFTNIRTSGDTTGVSMRDTIVSCVIGRSEDAALTNEIACRSNNFIG